MDKKQDILKQLTLLANDKKAKNDTFRYRAYIKAITAIKEHKEEIISVKDLDNINGLAKGSIREKIIEYIKTGNIKEIEKITNESTIIQTLSNI